MVRTALRKECPVRDRSTPQILRLCWHSWTVEQCVPVRYRKARSGARRWAGCCEEDLSVRVRKSAGFVKTPVSQKKLTLAPFPPVL